MNQIYNHTNQYCICWKGYESQNVKFLQKVMVNNIVIHKKNFSAMNFKTKILTMVIHVYFYSTSLLESCLRSHILEAIFLLRNESCSFCDVITDKMVTRSRKFLLYLLQIN